MISDSTYTFTLERANDLVEKVVYQPASPQEEFMVPVLTKALDDLLSEYAPVTNQRNTVLDVGCGRQPFRPEFERKGYHYMSIDAQQSPENSVDFVCEIDKLLPGEILNVAPFDLLFCTEVMEHVADWDMAFRNFSQLLKPGGKLLITCPHFYPLHEVPYDFWRPTPYALKYFGDKFDLKVIHQQNAGDAWDILGTLLGASHVMPRSEKLIDRLVNRLVRESHKILFGLLSKGILQSHSQWNSSLYLANIVVFERA